MSIARAMQLVGYALYAMAGMLRVINGGDAAPWHWLVAYAALGIAFHIGASVPNDARHRSRRYAALAVMIPAMFAMAIIRPCPYGAIALVVVASQLALVVPPRVAAIWITVQTLIIGSCVISALGWLAGAAEVIVLVGFQAFAVAAIASARGEADARSELQRVNGALLATQALLDEATRTRERTRIARDLHDVLGHDLTALGLQLEIAAHVEPVLGGPTRRRHASLRRGCSPTFARSSLPCIPSDHRCWPRRSARSSSTRPAWRSTSTRPSGSWSRRRDERIASYAACRRS